MASHGLSLAQQIAQLEEPGPVDLDPEDVHIIGVNSDDEAVVDQSAARAHYIDVGHSELRDRVLDPKYEGVRTTRKQLMEDNDGLPNNECDIEDQKKVGGGDEHNERDESGDESEGREAEDGEGGERDEEEDEKNRPFQKGSEDESGEPQTPPAVFKMITKDSEPTEDLSSMLRKTREEDRKKGKAISRQIALWDSILDARIRLQKAVTAANRLPEPAQLLQFTNSSECREALNRMVEEATLLSDELFELQEDLLLSNESISPPARKRRKVQPDDTPDYDSWFRDATRSASALEHAFHPYLVQTLSKWSAKIQAVAPSVLLPSNRNAFSKNSQHLKSAIQLIDETLTDHAKLLQRTRTPRGKGPHLNVSTELDGGAGKGDENTNVDMEMFDDTDFYQNLLRDVIDARNDIGGRDDWMAMQKQKKAKKTVDTKASKGRKLRYEMHEKLQNFMVPVPVQGAWHEEQIDELFASLLGRGFEAADLDSDRETVAANGRLGDQLTEALKDGFRVFG